jgi:hypothetical protein
LVIRLQLNYYGFVHVRSFSATGNSTTALWINQELAENEANDDISAVLKLRRVEPCETAKTVEGRRQRKELALHTVEEDIGLNSKTLQMDQIRSMAIRGDDTAMNVRLPPSFPFTQQLVSAPAFATGIPREVSIPADSSDESENYNSSVAGESNTAAANVLLMLARSS